MRFLLLSALIILLGNAPLLAQQSTPASGNTRTIVLKASPLPGNTAADDSTRALQSKAVRQAVLQRQAEGSTFSPESFESQFTETGKGDSRAATSTPGSEPKLKKAKDMPFYYQAAADPEQEMQNYQKAKAKWIAENPEAWQKMQKGQ